MNNTLSTLHLAFRFAAFLILTIVAHAQTGLTQLGEFKVNVTPGEPFVARPSVGSDGNGNFIVVWDSYASDGSDYGVYMRRYNSAGSPLAFTGYPLAERRVNTTTTANQDSPNVAVRSDGSFIVVWNSLNQVSASSNYDIYFQRFDQDANTIGGEILVNSTFTANAQQFADVATNDHGEFVVVWQSEDQDGSGLGAYAQRYTSSGIPTGGPIQVSAATNGNQQRPGVAMDANGKFAIVWQSDAPGGGGDSFDIYLRRFAADGTPIPNSEVRVNSFVAGVQSVPRISMASDGRFAVAWVSDGQDGDGTGIVARSFTADGTGNSEQVVNQFPGGNQDLATITMAATGEFVVVYQSNSLDGSGQGVAARRFTVTGDPIGDEFVVNTTVTDDQVPSTGCAACFDPQGNLVFVWAHTASEIRADKFYLPNQDPPLTEFRVNTTTANSQTSSTVAMNGAGSFQVAWQTPGANGYAKINAQRYLTLGLRDGSELIVADGANAGDQVEPSAAMAASGRSVVIWRSYGSGNSAPSIQGRLYDTDGVTVVRDFQANSANPGNDIRPAPSVSMRADGGFVVVWSSKVQDGTHDIFGQRFDADGLTIGTEFSVNTTTAYEQDFPRVAMNASGAFAVAWRSATASGYEVRMRLFDANAAGQPGDFIVNTALTGEYNLPAIGIDSAGKTLVAWSSPGDTDGVGIFARRFDESGTAIPGQPADSGTGTTNQFRVNTTFVGNQGSAQIGMAPDGSFLVAWQSPDGNDIGIFAQRYTAAGLRSGSELPINRTTAAEQSFQLGSGGQRVAMDASGNFVTTWDSNGQDGDGFGIYATKVFVSVPTAVTTLDATDVADKSVTLHGVINPNGQTATVAFDYDEDPNFNSPSVIQVPGAFTGFNSQNFAVGVTGLTKDVRYYFRAKATYGVQTIIGSTLFFTTADLAPTAHDYTIYLKGNGGGAFDFVKGDEDADGDVATIAMVDAHAVDMSNNPVADVLKNPDGTVQVTPHAGFVGLAKFHYTLTDGQLGSPAATVTVVAYAFVGGTYNGYIGDGTGTSAANGYLQLTVDALGGFSAQLTFGGRTYAVNGGFNDSGLVSVFVPGTNPPLYLKLTVDPITGAISGHLVAADNSGFDAPINLLHLENGTADNAPHAGTYTMFLDPTGAATTSFHTNLNSPAPMVAGSGYAVVRIRKRNPHTGQSPAAFVGLLPDAMPYSSGKMGVVIAQDGQSDPRAPQRVYQVSTNPYQKVDKIKGVEGSVRTSPVVSVAADASHTTTLSGGNGVVHRPPSSLPAAPYPTGYDLGFDINQAAVMAAPHLPFDQGQRPSNAHLDFSMGGIVGAATGGHLLEPIFVNRQGVATFLNIPADQRKKFAAHVTVAFAPGLAGAAPVPLFAGKFVHDDGSGQVDTFHGVFVRPPGSLPFQGKGNFTGKDAQGNSRTGLVEFLKGP